MPKAASCPGNNEYPAGKYAAESVGTYNIQICIGICIAPYIRIQTKEQAQSEDQENRIAAVPRNVRSGGGASIKLL